MRPGTHVHRLILIPAFFGIALASNSSNAYAPPQTDSERAYLERTSVDIARKVRDLEWQGAFDLAEDVLFRLPNSSVGLKWMGVALNGLGLQHEAAGLLARLQPEELGQEGRRALDSARAATCDVELELTVPSDKLPEVERRTRLALETLVASETANQMYRTRLDSLRAKGRVPPFSEISVSEAGPQGGVVLRIAYVPARGRQRFSVALADLQLDSPTIDLDLSPRAQVRHKLVVQPYARTAIRGARVGDVLEVGEGRVPIEDGEAELPPGTKSLALIRGSLRIPLTIIEREPNVVTVPGIVLLILNRESGDLAVTRLGQSIPFTPSGTATIVAEPGELVSLEMSAPRRLPKTFQFNLSAGEVIEQRISIQDLAMDAKWVQSEEADSARTIATGLTFGGIAMGALALGSGAASITFDSPSPAWGYVAVGSGVVAAGLLAAGIYMFATNPKVSTAGTQPPSDVAVRPEAYRPASRGHAIPVVVTFSF